MKTSNRTKSQSHQQSLIKSLVYVLVACLLVIFGIGIGTIVYDMSRFPRLQIIANKVFIKQLSTHEKAFLGCKMLPDIITSLRSHSDDIFDETMATHQEQVTNMFMNWRMQTKNNIPFYARYHTDALYSMILAAIDSNTFEKNTVQPLIADLREKGFEFPALQDIPVYGNGDGYTRRIGVTREFKSTLTEEIILGRYVLEANTYTSDAQNADSKESTLMITINCKEQDAEYLNYQPYDEVYDWYAHSVTGIEPDTVVGFDPIYADYSEGYANARIFAFDIGTPSKAWLDASKELWIKEGENTMRLLQTLQTKPDCELLRKNDIPDGILCINTRSGLLEN